MTTVAAVVLGLIIGLAITRRRAALIVFAVLWTIVLIAQTWRIGSGNGNAASDTVTQPVYWLVQVASLAAGLAITAGFVALRKRKSGRVRTV